MKTALIAISTTGTRKETFDVVSNISKSLIESHIRPVFSICSDNPEIFKNSNDMICFSLKNSGDFDYGYHIIEAIERGIDTFKPDFIASIADDFISPSKEFKNVIIPLFEDSDATFGSWGSAKIAATYPKFQYVSELFVNRMANFASKSSNLKINDLSSYSFDYKSDFSNMIQIFTGIFGFRESAWHVVLDKMLEVFGSKKLKWSFEVALLLSSMEVKLRIKNVACNRTKEPEPPILGEATTRITQMKDAFEYVNIFLKNSNQYKKLNEISGIQTEMIKIVGNLLNDST